MKKKTILVRLDKQGNVVIGTTFGKEKLKNDIVLYGTKKGDKIHFNFTQKV